MPRLVLDTNVLISSLIRKNTPPYQLYAAWREGVFDLITSRDQLNELERVLSHEKLQRFFTPNEAQAMLAGIRIYSVCVPSIPEVHFSPDPDDDKIIATAIAGNANYIITGDKADLLALNAVKNIGIITVSQAVSILENNYC